MHLYILEDYYKEDLKSDHIVFDLHLQNTLINSKLVVCVEKLKKGHIQVTLYNTSASVEASIMPGTKIAELTFSYSVSPLLYWRDDLQKECKEQEQHPPKDKEAVRKTKRWTRTPNRCDKVTNWRAKTNPYTSIPTENPAEVWVPVTPAQPPPVEDWDLEEAANPAQYAFVLAESANTK